MGKHESDQPSQTAPPSTQPIRAGRHPDRVGPYKILGLLGEGGFGVVYSAEQTEPVRRQVALKVIKPGMDSKAVLARFEAEEQALALMDHPNVAKVFEAGITEQGRPYFAMEHVAGIPITEHCDRHKLSIEERLHLFMQVCEAVHHAHQKAVIHRDIKPSNILVAFKDSPAPYPVANGRAGAHPPLRKGGPGGVPKVIDFGVAKAIGYRLTEKTIFTEQGQLIGTPAYMSPEQAEMTAQDVDTRSDIYSLGVLLYELLTGALPLDPKSLFRAAFDEIRRIIREVDPPKPSTRLSTFETEPEAQAPGSPGTDHDGWHGQAELAREEPPAAGESHGQTSLPMPPRQSSVGDIARHRRADPKSLVRRVRGDLDWITMKALEKDRSRRYASASDFAADIRRHLNHEPVIAGPPGAAYRLKKFVRRNRGLVTGIAAVFVVLAAGVAMSTWFAVQATQARELAETRLEQVEQAKRETEAERDRAVAAEEQQSRERQRAEQARALAEQRQDEAEAQRTEAERQAAIAQAVNDFLNDDLLAAVAPEEQGKDVTMRQVLDKASEAIEGKFENEPLVEAAVRMTLADTYESLGVYKQAEPHLEGALHLRRSELGDDHPDTLTSINNIGHLLWAMGRYEEAEPHWADALERRRRILGDDHPDTLNSINNMGLLMHVMGKFADAEPYCREALEGHRRVLGADHPNTLASINKMGVLLRSMGKLAEAEPYFREALEGKRRVLGDDHPNTLISIHNMGFLLQSMGKLAEAEPYWREALKGNRRVLGADHPNTLGSVGTMGFLLQSMGKLAEAEPYYREALEGTRRVQGDDHPSTLTWIHNMGRLLRDLGRLQEAEALGAEAVHRARRSLPQGHWLTGVFLAAYGKTLAQLERYTDTEAALLEAHEILEAALGPEHERTIKVIRSLVDLYDAWDAAEPGKSYAAKAAQWRTKLPPKPEPEDQ